MIVDVLSVFPGMFEVPMGTSMLGIAQKKGLLDFRAHDLRDWTHDRHKTTDDEPFGGGAGQLMKCEPIFEALDELTSASYCEVPAKTIFFTPCGVPFTQEVAQKLSHEQRLIMVCGRYEGIDERAYTRADLCISLGDYVLTGGELAAMVVTDAAVRLIPGVLGDEASPVEESFAEGLLEYPQYTRPASCRGMDVPEVLLSGDHAKVAAWRRAQSIERTARLRPDLLAAAALSQEEKTVANMVICEEQERASAQNSADKPFGDAAGTVAGNHESSENA